MDQHLNADFSRRVVIDTTRLAWRPSPAAGVMRKRLHLDGPNEAGIVTSIVRYAPASRFAPHSHHGGEEIFVLSGEFGDEHGRYPAGTYMLNPDGTSHAPEAEEGCVLFVKLRQYAGAGRLQAAIRTPDLAWEAGDAPGVATKPLYHQDGFAETMALLRIEPGARPAAFDAPGGEELLVIAGELIDEHGSYRAGTWIRNPAGHRARRSSPQGATALVRTGWINPVG